MTIPDNETEKGKPPVHRQEPITIKEGLKEATEYLEELMTKSDPYSLKTGHEPIDDVLSRLSGGELIFIAGGPGVGKSTFAMSLVQLLAAYKKTRSGIYSLEMPAAQYVARMICSQSSVKLSGVEESPLTVRDWHRVVDGCTDLADLGIMLDDPASLTVDELFKKAHKLKKQHEVQLLLIDSVDLLEPSAGCEADISYANTVASLKHLARELKIPVLVTGQAVSNDHLNAVQQFADVVLRLDRATPTDTDRAATTMTVLKNRYGAAGMTVNLNFNPKWFRFDFPAPTGRGEN